MNDLARRIGAIETTAAILRAMSETLNQLDPTADHDRVLSMLATLDDLLNSQRLKLTPDTPRPSLGKGDDTDLPF